MSKFNTPSKARATGAGFVKTEATPTLRTGNGAAGYARDAQSDLFLLGVSNFVGENTFYEGAGNRDARFAELSAKVAVADLDWMTRFVKWLRNDANMRSASLVAAIEGAKALNKAGLPGGRALVAASMARADEPGEAIAYWYANYGRAIPKAVKRGIADAAASLYGEYSLAKYDTASKGFRFGDVIEQVHPSPRDAKQSDLFKYALDRRRDTKVDVPESLSMLRNRAAFNALSPAEVREVVNGSEATEVLKAAGLTWEALSGSIAGGMDAKAWEAVIPSMGYMALLRNLRNFEQAGVSESVLDSVAKRLADPEEVARSRQLPMRFLSAYNATQGSLRFGFPLERALQASLANVPVLKRRSLILVDRSASMFGFNYGYSRNTNKSDLDWADTAATFGTALALRAEDATLVQFGTSSAEISLKKGDSVLSTLKKFQNLGGTATASALQRHFKNHDRVIILTDEQVNYGQNPSSVIPANVPMYTFNLAGYRASQGAAGPNRVYFGGLTDACFGLIPLIERGRKADWPF